MVVWWAIRLRQGLRRDKGGDILDERIRMEKKNWLLSIVYSRFSWNRDFDTRWTV